MNAEAENLKGLTAKQWAERLNGREYRRELTKEEEAALAEAGIVVMFGRSDDL